MTKHSKDEAIREVEEFAQRSARELEALGLNSNTVDGIADIAAVMIGNIDGVAITRDEAIASIKGVVLAAIDYTVRGLKVQ